MIPPESYKMIILELENGYWFVGRTSKDINNENWKNEITLNKWLEQHKPIKIKQMFDQFSWELNKQITIELMAKYGYEKVRSSSYRNPILRKEPEAVTLYKITLENSFSPF